MHAPPYANKTKHCTLQDSSEPFSNGVDVQPHAQVVWSWSWSTATKRQHKRAHIFATKEDESLILTTH